VIIKDYFLSFVFELVCFFYFLVLLFFVVETFYYSYFNDFVKADIFETD